MAAASSSQSTRKKVIAGRPARPVGAGTPAQPIDDPLVIGSFGSAQAETVESPPESKHISHFEIIRGTAEPDNRYCISCAAAYTGNSGDKPRGVQHTNNPMCPHCENYTERLCEMNPRRLTYLHNGLHDIRDEEMPDAALCSCGAEYPLQPAIEVANSCEKCKRVWWTPREHVTGFPTLDNPGYNQDGGTGPDQRGRVPSRPARTCTRGTSAT